jgi:hypothetical protein
MRKIVCLLVLACIHASVAGADFLESTPVGPGIVHHHEFQQGGPWHLNVLEVDLSVDWIHLETVKANDRLSGYERTSSMAARNDDEMHRVVGATNGDFYGSGGVPSGAQVLDGTLLKRPFETRSVFGSTLEKIPFIEIVSFHGQILAPDDSCWDIHGINETRQTDNLVVYNKYYGTATQTNYWGTEVTAEYLTEPLAINDTISVVVVAKDSVMETGHGNNAIPSNGIVISGHGTARDFLNEHTLVGDTLALILRLPPLSQSIVELIGGGPRLIRDGTATVESVAEGFGQSFATDRHPRTAVGFSQDSTKLYLFTVDGRQPEYSVGMSLYELADYMLGWDVFQGINLDGGGSTTIVVRGQVVNSPSDAGGERTVANALMVISTAPTGPLALLRIHPDEAYVLAETQVQFSASGFDQYYNPVSLEPDSLEWSCDTILGSIDENGLFTAGSDEVTGYIYAAQDTIRDSALVHITNIASIDLLPNPIILEVGEQQTITPEARDAYGNLIELSAIDYQWSLVGEMGEISAAGVFTATQPGEGYVIATYHTISGSTAVSVGIPTDVILDDFSEVSNWSLTGVLVNLSECSLTIDSSVIISPPSSGRLHYSLTTGGTSALYLNGTIPISGTPDAIGIHVYGDGRGHWLRGEFEDVDVEKFLVNFTDATPGIDWTNSWRYLEVPLEEAVPHWGNPSATLTFPITWKKIYLAETEDVQKDSGTVFLDDFTASFIETDVEINPKPPMPELFRLEQNYPNPFNPTTQIGFGLARATPVRLEVYNIMGQRVTTLLNRQMPPGHHLVQFDAHDLASGIYFYRLEANDWQQTKKMVFLK